MILNPPRHVNRAMAAIMNRPKPMETHNSHMVLYPKMAPDNMAAVRVPAPRVRAESMNPGPPSLR